MKDESERQKSEKGRAAGNHIIGWGTPLLNNVDKGPACLHSE